MAIVYCENPRCQKPIDKDKAAQFKDTEHITHYSCDNEVCKERARIAVDLSEE